MKKKVVRLFDSLKPENYEIELDLIPERMAFKGRVVIKAKKTGRPSKRITLHQKELKILSAKLTRQGKNGEEVISVDRINTHKAYEEVRLHSSKMLYPGEYTISIQFSGIISRSMNGLYPCDFKLNGESKQLLATQFESHHAREVLPCVDEPEAKATFNLKLVTPSEHTTLSNTPVKEQTKKGGKIVTLFETTPVMSTYLLAFVYGELGYNEAKTSSGTVVRAYATPDNVKHLDFALETSVKCLDFYEDYFDIPYPLKKCDMVALPDFASGAMENWGLITYREQALLVDNKNTSSHAKQYVAMVVAHELAHMWFGNLVTMRWWTDLWLNEGFASWIEYMAVDYMFPKWNMRTQYIADEQAAGLKQDALEHTHPVEVPIGHPDEIRSIFDAISYQKGSSVIHMLHDYLGADTFREGLRHYLKKHAYGNTDTIDLWSALEEVSKKPVKQFMLAWTTQAGYPVVNASLSEKALELSQSRFILNPKHGQVKDELWPVPLLASRNIDPSTLKDKNIKINYTPQEKPLIINQGHRGFYRVAYDENHLKKLSKHIPTMGSEDRLGILSDAFEGAKAGHNHTTSAFTLLAAYKDETDTSVWDVISSNITELRRVMDDEQLRESMKPFIRNLVNKQYERLGWEESPKDTYSDRLLRPTILGLAAGADHPAALEEVKKRFNAAKKSEDIRPDVRGVVYATSARLGGKAEFDKLLRMHDKSNSAEEKITLAAALSNFQQSEFIDKSLGFIKSDRVRLQDVAYWLAYSLSNRKAKFAAWYWIKDNWEWMQQNLGNDLSFYRTPVYVARSFSEESFINDYEKFFKPKKSPAIARSIDQGLEILQWQTEWKKRDLKNIKNFM